MDDRFRLFVRLWGIAALAHVVGNWQLPNVPSPAGLSLLLVGLGGIALALAPARRPFLALCAAIVVSAVCEAPRLYNHWILAALVSLGGILSAGRAQRFVPTARLVLLGFYSWAAVAKLNSGFFTRETSCGLFYANHSLAALGLPAISADSMWAFLPIATAAVIELAVPPLLIARRTRTAGVALASIFHGIISLDLAQHFYDFTSVLLPLFVLFLPEASVARISRRLSAWASRLPRALPLTFAVAGGIMVGAAVVPLQERTAFLVREMPFVLWIPFVVAFVAAGIAGRSSADPPDGMAESVGRGAGWPGIGLVAATLLNGATPYLEIKTAGGFNMYANLLTAQGRSNHYLLRRTWPMRDGYDAPVEIVESSDPGLLRYRTEGYRVAYPELRRYLSERPDVSLTYRRGHRLVVVGRAGDNPEFGDAGPWWWRYFGLRSLDTLDPPRCQDHWLVAL